MVYRSLVKFGSYLIFGSINGDPIGLQYALGQNGGTYRVWIIDDDISQNLFTHSDAIGVRRASQCHIYRLLTRHPDGNGDRLSVMVVEPANLEVDINTAENPRSAGPLMTLIAHTV